MRRSTYAACRWSECRSQVASRVAKTTRISPGPRTMRHTPRVTSDALPVNRAAMQSLLMTRLQSGMLDTEEGVNEHLRLRMRWPA